MGPNKLIVERGTTSNLDQITVSGDKAAVTTVKGGFEGPVGLSHVSDTLRPERAAENVFGPKLKTEKPPPFKA
jgi:hypothetical protein